MVNFSLSDITRGVSSTVVARAKSYEKKVRIVERKPGLISAQVQGTHLYLCHVQFNTTGTKISQVCSCPYGAPCKHTIALARVISRDKELLECLLDTIMPYTPSHKPIVLNSLEKLRLKIDKIEAESQSVSTKSDRLERQAYYILKPFPDSYLFPKAGSDPSPLRLEVGIADRQRGETTWRFPENTREIKPLYSSHPKYLSQNDIKLLQILYPLPYGSNPFTWHSVELDGFVLPEVLRYLCLSPQVYLETSQDPRESSLIPLVISDPSRLQIRVNVDQSGWTLNPETVFGEDIRQVEIQTVFNFIPNLILTTKQEMIPLENEIDPQVLKTITENSFFDLDSTRGAYALETLLLLQNYLPIILPPELKSQIETATPTPVVIFRSENSMFWESEMFIQYGTKRLPITQKFPRYLNEDSKIIERNLEAEKRVLQTYLDLNLTEYTSIEEIERVATALPLDWEIYLDDDDISKLHRGDFQINFQSNSGIDWLDITGEVTVDNGKYNLAELILAGASKGRLIQLRGQHHLLDTKLFDQIKKLSSLADKNGLVRLNRTHVGLVESLDMIDHNSLHTTWRKTLQAIKSFDGVSKTQKIKKLNATLRPYQQHGVSYLNFLQEMSFGGILADDMGLGKTIQAIAMLTHYRNQHPTLCALIIAPTSVLSNWANEINKFAPHLRVYSNVGTNRVFPKTKDFDVLLTTYPLLRFDTDVLTNTKFDYVILDEAQYAKNFKTKTAEVIRNLQATHKLCLTGTPIENNLSELYTQMQFLNPGMFGSHEDFKNQFAIPIEKQNNSTQSQHLQKLLKPFILRRTKENVLSELPPKTEQLLTMEMAPDQQKIYDSLRHYYQAKLLKLVDSQGIGKSHIQILEALLRLRQACCDPRLLKSAEHSSSVKTEEVIKRCQEIVASGHKVLLFSQFTSMIDILHDELAKNNIETLILTGKTTVKKRTALVKEFQDGNDPVVFLLSLKAGGVGLNLTAASYVIHFDPWWNPAVENQATDRAHRIGQTKAVTVYKLIVANTIEEKILHLQNKKKDLIDKIIAGDSAHKQLTKQDLESLLGS